MLAYIIRRILQSVLVMLVVALVSFSLFRFVGDPINSMVGQEATIADREALRDRAGAERSVPDAIRHLCGQCRAGQFRHILPPATAGDGADPVAPARDAGTGAGFGDSPPLSLGWGLASIPRSGATDGCRTRS
jgi:hypothetical protein